MNVINTKIYDINNSYGMCLLHIVSKHSVIEIDILVFSKNIQLNLCCKINI